MTVGEVEIGEALLVIAALLRDMDLREGKTCDRSDAQSGKDERISGREPRVAIRDDFLGAAKACEGDQSACGSGRFERGKESEDAEGPCHEGQEERDEEGRPCDLRELRWRGEKSKQEEDHHGEKSSFQKQY